MSCGLHQERRSAHTWRASVQPGFALFPAVHPAPPTHTHTVTQHEPTLLHTPHPCTLQACAGQGMRCSR